MEAAGLIAFILLIMGTIGLLANEFVFNWGSVSTVVFAVVNFLGLAMLSILYLKRKAKHRKKEG